MLGNISISNHISARVRDSGEMGFLLRGWVAAALWFRHCPDWDGLVALGGGRPSTGWGPSSLPSTCILSNFLILADIVVWHQM